MNSSQRRAVVVGALVLLLMGLVPPWKHVRTFGSISSEQPAGYHLILSPPSVRSSSHGFGWGVQLDFARLLMQCIVVIVATGAVVVVLHGPTFKRG